MNTKLNGVQTHVMEAGRRAGRTITDMVCQGRHDDAARFFEKFVTAKNADTATGLLILVSIISDIAVLADDDERSLDSYGITMPEETRLYIETVIDRYNTEENSIPIAGLISSLVFEVLSHKMRGPRAVDETDLVLDVARILCEVITATPNEEKAGRQKNVGTLIKEAHAAGDLDGAWKAYRDFIKLSADTKMVAAHSSVLNAALLDQNVGAMDDKAVSTFGTQVDDPTVNPHRVTAVFRAMALDIVRTAAKTAIPVEDIYHWASVTGATWSLINICDQIGQDDFMTKDMKLPPSKTKLLTELHRVETKINVSPRSGFARKTLISLLDTRAALSKEESAANTSILAAEPNRIKPHQLADWRRTMIKQTNQIDAGFDTLRVQRMLAGLLRPTGTGPFTGAEITLAQERQRLTEATMFYMGEEANDAASRKAGRGKTLPLAAHRIPEDHGLIAFHNPIKLPNDMNCDVIGWGTWDASVAPHSDVISDWEALDYTGAQTVIYPDPYRPGYVHQSIDNVDDGGGKMIWVTFYASPDSGDTYQKVGSAALIIGSTIPLEAKAIQHLVACWDIITQERVSTSITEETILRRHRRDLAGDHRAGIRDDSRTRVIQLKGHSAARERDHIRGTSGHTYSKRWWVDDFDRNHCRNPHAHKRDLPHEHEDILILGHVRGPEGAPMIETTAKERTVLKVGN